jgi:hypothetical protein
VPSLASDVTLGSRLGVAVVSGAERIEPVHRGAGPQLDNLCGPYWLSILLTAFGRDVSQVRAAGAAATLLPSGGDPASWVPPGEPNRPPDASGLRRFEDASACGTSAPGMVRAVRELSEGAFAFVPVRARRGASLDADGLLDLVDVAAAGPEPCVPLLNLRTGKLWGAALSPLGALLALSGGANAAEPEWDVGHFVAVAGAIRAEARSLLLLLDTYPSLGCGGSHWQPAEAVAAAVRRDDGREGGCLLFVAAEREEATARRLGSMGFECAAWDNGTRDEGGLP